MSADNSASSTMGERKTVTNGWFCSIQTVATALSGQAPNVTGRSPSEDVSVRKNGTKNRTVGRWLPLSEGVLTAGVDSWCSGAPG